MHFYSFAFKTTLIEKIILKKYCSQWTLWIQQKNICKGYEQYVTCMTELQHWINIYKILQINFFTPGYLNLQGTQKIFCFWIKQGWINWIRLDLIENWSILPNLKCSTYKLSANFFNNGSSILVKIFSKSYVKKVM